MVHLYFFNKFFANFCSILKSWEQMFCTSCQSFETCPQFKDEYMYVHKNYFTVIDDVHYITFTVFIIVITQIFGKILCQICMKYLLVLHSYC